MYDKKFSNFSYVCPGCLQEWKKCSCFMYPLTLIQIDKKILPTIQVLNQKNYRTESCCEGHIGDCEKIYIIFRKKYKVASIPKGFNGDGQVITAKITGCSAEAKKRKKRQLHRTLYEWACSLEPLNN